MTKKIDILTLFPNMVNAAFQESIIARAVSKGLLELNCHQIRQYTTNKQGKVDDYPYSGGPGLVMAYQPIADCIRSVSAGDKPYIIYVSPQGKPFNQKKAQELVQKENLMILCGHYEGVDERVLEEFIDEEVSLGDFVLTGGEIPAMAIADCIARLIPGVLAEGSAEKESHSGLLLEYPQYTRPAEIEGKKIPEILLSGKHDEIEKWQVKTAEERTKRKRPDLYEIYEEQKLNSQTYYFDNSATTRQDDGVTEEMCRTVKFLYGNPSSLHHMGLEAERKLTSARKIIAETIGASEKEIYFTACATESNNWALRGYLEANPRAGKKVLISSTEHPSVSETAAFLSKNGYQVELLTVDNKGIVDMDKLRSALTPDTAIVSVMHVNSETGTIQPIKEISSIAKAVNPNIAVHSDCVQSYGKLPVSAKLMGVDMLSVSAHKIHGPRGVGFLYVKDGIRIAPLLCGGGQEKALRSGTENLPGIAGFAKIAKEACGKLEEHNKHVKELNKIFREIITEEIRSSNIISNEEGCPYVLSVSFPGLRAEVIQHSVEQKGVYVSVGSACSSHKKDRSPTLTAMGYNNNIIDGAIRISFTYQNTKEQADYAARVICAEVKKLYGRRKGRK
ncbi:MAG: tRNA (guanosine(37)-N1)-methyltransferase TrmD [Clostridia bacterium]|nr:tRNA (guanosine(37)-N1)-methyltransferase TrmD [Clostridia bacterium]